jgi:hypothetical protein
MADPPPYPGTSRDDDQDAGSTMLTAEAVVQTANPARYIVRLGRHASQMSAHSTQPGRHRPRGSRGGDAPPEVRQAEWSDTEGTVTLNWGRWTMQAAGRTLTVRAEATDEQNLQRIQDLLTARLTSFGRREHLTVNWQRAPAASAAEPAATVRSRPS